jgi:lipopolysaccharide biosynthesis regulator YciM
LKKNQIFITAIIMLAGIALFCFGDLLGPPKSKSTNVAEKTNNEHDQNLMNPSSDVPDLDFQDYVMQFENKLSSEKQNKVKVLAGKVKLINSAIANKDLAEFWEKEKELSIAAYYYKKAAFLENTEKSITFAGNLLMVVMNNTEQPSLRKWQASEAIECFKKALELNPENVDTKIALASCYTEGTGETMKGVTLLREVTQKDSNNISANIILGKLAIQSGQLDKAVKRLERVLTLRPNNTEAMYFLAEAYKGQGKKTKAVELFEKCKKITNNPNFSKEIDNYIKTF